MNPASARFHKNDQAPSAMPRMYQTAKVQARVLTGLVAFTATLVIGSNVLRLIGVGAAVSAMLLVLMLIACTGAVIWIAPQISTRVLLYEDAIELKGLFSSRKLRRDVIRGYRLVAVYRSGLQYVILPLDKTKGNLALPLSLHTDKYFHAWMKTIPKIE